ncbi:putative alpha/beta hydrolase [Cyphellophora attinorum]|uniref:Putative alpha/beta hydrolase n=1 Tax=Cyphellophora attinorum TaxID=1664694 RepID=A0A0N1I1C4_9EURO|nr:putative alpha/beta hydrolase [Phialophora attinorum]KPI45616.1 putative alpha/beta hydrolase [Phialophora attinorum]
MSGTPVPNPNPYVDQDCAAFEEQAATLADGASLASVSASQFRQLLKEFQTPAPKHSGITTAHFEVKTSAFGNVKTFLVKPSHSEQDLPVIFYVHGGGWISGDFFDWESLVFDLVERTGFALVFPHYTLAPEARFPTQQEQCLEVLQYIVKHGRTKGLMPNKIVIAGDSAGGQIVPAINILNQQRDLDLPISHQILMFPAIDSSTVVTRFSEFLFQDGPLINEAFLIESLDDYFGPLPVSAADRSSILASPILMTAAQAKEFMPPTTIVTGQADYLRDQGEDFARLLQTSGVECGVLQGVALLHDSVVFNLARKSPTVELIMIMVAGKIKEVLGEGKGVKGLVEQNGNGEPLEHGGKRKRRS